MIDLDLVKNKAITALAGGTLLGSLNTAFFAGGLSYNNFQLRRQTGPLPQKITGAKVKLKH